MTWREIKRPAELFGLYKADPATLVRINGAAPEKLGAGWSLVLPGGTPLIVGMCALGVWRIEVEETSAEQDPDRVQI